MEVTSSYTKLAIKSRYANFRKTIGAGIVLCAVIGFVYLTFWCGVISDDIILDYTEKFFKPLAQFLNPNDTTYDIYKNTGIYMFLGILPLFLAQYIADIMEECEFKNLALKEEKEKIKLQKQLKEDFECRFDYINNYSICLSIDYEGKKEIKQSNKQTFNKAIFNKISNNLNKIDLSGNSQISDVLIYSSSDFSRYDIVYETILNTLATCKKGIEGRYETKLIPSLTTDASSSLATNKIRKEHFEIQSFNFKNRALTTANFANKYKHLKNKKYAGIPIGEYAYFGNGKMGTYELNVIHKNLNYTLSQAM